MRELQNGWKLSVCSAGEDDMEGGIVKHDAGCRVGWTGLIWFNPILFDILICIQNAGGGALAINHFEKILHMQDEA